MKTKTSSIKGFCQLYKQALEESFYRMEIRDQKKIVIVSLAQVFLSVLDLFGVLLLGLLAAIAIGGSSEVKAFPFLSSNTKFDEFMSYEFKSQILILGTLVFVFSTVKILLGTFLIRKILFFVARISAETSAQLLHSILNTSMRKVRSYSTQEYIYSANRGVETLTIQILAATIFLLADLFALLLLVLLLFFVNWQVTLAIIIFYTCLSLFTMKILSKLTSVTGAKLSRYSIKSHELASDSLNLYKEIWVRRGQHDFANALYRARLDLSRSIANYNLIPYLSKNSLELSFTFITTFLLYYLFIVNESTNSIAIFSLFIATITRILPIILRLQQSSLQIKINLSSTSETMRIFRDFPGGGERSDRIDENLFQHIGLDPSIVVSNVHFSHDESDLVLFEQVSFQIKSGSLVAIVGASGQGKTSLVNLLLGLLEPSKGTISISGMSPLHAITSWPGGIAYLPQRPELLNGSIRDNVILGWKHSHNLDTRVFDALEKAQLSQLVTSLPGGIDTQIKDLNLSGGELQRLGIARALYTSPKLLILDEPTIALDLQVESDARKVLDDLRNEITILVISHTANFAPDPDMVLFVDYGRVLVLDNYMELEELNFKFNH